MSSKKLIVTVAIILVVGVIAAATQANWLPWVNELLSWAQQQIGVDPNNVFQIPTTP